MRPSLPVTAWQNLPAAVGKLDPRHLWRSPVILVVWVGSVLTTALSVVHPSTFSVAVTVWLWATVLFANLAEAVAEGRGGAAGGGAVRAVSALGRCAAEAQRPGIAEHVGMLPVDIEPLELSAVIPAGRLIGDGVDWRIAQAVAAALPNAIHPDGRVVLSVDTARYRGTGVEPVESLGAVVQAAGINCA